MKDLSRIGHYLTLLFDSKGKGYAYILLFNKRWKLIDTVRLKKNGRTEQYTIDEIIDKSIKRSSASAFVIAHNHYGNPPIPSGDDIHSTAILRRRYESSDVLFYEHFIISGAEYKTLIHEEGFYP